MYAFKTSLFSMIYVEHGDNLAGIYLAEINKMIRKDERTCGRPKKVLHADEGSERPQMLRTCYVALTRAYISANVRTRARPQAAETLLEG